MDLKRTAKLVAIFAASAFLTAGLFVIHPKFLTRKKEGNSVFFPDRNLKINVELAMTPYQWSKGLMFRDSLGENSGMFFIFPDEAKRIFWMKDTEIPLDLIFISKDLKVVDIKAGFEPCKAMICPNYESSAPAMYVLEVNAGFAKKNGISLGDKVSF